MASVPVRSILEDACNETALCPDELSGLQMPVLLVWGASERLLPPSHLTYFARVRPLERTLPRCLVRPDTAGHEQKAMDRGARARGSSAVAA
jgi:pimeloyl-ACP methyl ester carboxylesterase